MVSSRRVRVRGMHMRGSVHTFNKYLISLLDTRCWDGYCPGGHYGRNQQEDSRPGYDTDQAPVQGATREAPGRHFRLGREHGYPPEDCDPETEGHSGKFWENVLCSILRMTTAHLWAQLGPCSLKTAPQSRSGSRGTGGHSCTAECCWRKGSRPGKVRSVSGCN